MKSNAKSKIVILITLGILFALSPIITTNLSFIMGNSDRSSENSDEINLDNEDPKISKVSGHIYINDDIPTSNWSVAEAAGICTGKGTYSEPYIIEDLVIDGGGSFSCISIRNSNVFFKIENCTVYNAGDDYDAYELGHAGIRLYNTGNGTLIDNDCSSNIFGINLISSNNNTILGNTANNNIYYVGFGIHLESSNNNTISENTVNNNGNGIFLNPNCNYNNISSNIANNNGGTGIFLDFCGGIKVSGNVMNECGLLIDGNLEQLASNDIDSTNLVNGKPLYFYTNEVNLGVNDFLNAGQVILVNCNESLILNLRISQSNTGITLHYCNDNTITGNVVNDNNGFNDAGIYLSNCFNNNISRNTAYNNDFGIYLYGGRDNTITGNNASHNEKIGIFLYTRGGNSISENTLSYNHRGIYLYGSRDNTITGNTANYNQYGIYLTDYSNNNTVSGNTANYNQYGIYLTDFSNDNTVSGNKLIGNGECIVEENCYRNIFENNDCGQGDGIIPGYNVFLLLGILSVVAIIISKKLKKS